MAYDRHDEQRGWRDERPRCSGDERGFFERAGEQIASWFGDDDDRGRNERGGWRARERGGDEREWRGGRDSWRPESRDRGSAWRDDPGRSPRDLWSDESSGGGYRPMAGDYGRAGRFESPRFEERGAERRPMARPQWDRDDDRHSGFAGSATRSAHDDEHY